MKITQITYSMGLSISLAPYQNIKPMFSATGSLEETDDLTESANYLKQFVEKEIKESYGKYKKGIDQINNRKLEDEKRKREEAEKQKQQKREQNKRLIEEANRKKALELQKKNASNNNHPNADSPQ